MDSSIKFNVSANTAQFQSGMRQVDTVAKSTAAGIKTAFAGVGNMLVGGAMVAGLNKLLDQFGRIDDLAIRFGTNAESIQRVGYAAQLAGTDIEAVANAMTKAGIAATTAAREGGKAAETFGRAGISAKSFADADLAEKVVMIAEAYAKAGGSADKTAAIIEIMGARAGANLIPLISNLEELRERMSGVAVASSEITKRLAEAGDMLDKWKNQLTVSAVGGIQVFTDSMERLGSTIGTLDTKKLLQLAVATTQLALTGNVRPLWEVLQTGKTIKEMEEIEARANAINQLTREGAFGINAEKNAALIVDRTEQILAATRDINQQMSISEETLDSSLGLEKEKTAELAKQAEQLARQEAQRQGAIRDMGAEIALIEAQLSGNKKLEESLREQADFQSAFEKTGDTEEAAKFAAAKAAERAAQAAKQGGGSGGGGFSSGGVNRSALDRLQDMSRGGDVNARAALMRAEAEQARNLANTATLSERGSFGSAARQQIRSEERMQDRAMRELTKQTRDQFFGARNAGDAARNFERDAFKSGMTTKEAMDKMGIDRKFGENTRDALDRFAKEQAKTETERAREQADSGGVGGGGGRGGGAGEQPATEATLKQIFEKIQERPILVA